MLPISKIEAYCFGSVFMHAKDFSLVIRLLLLNYNDLDLSSTFKITEQ